MAFYPPEMTVLAADPNGRGAQSAGQSPRPWGQEPSCDGIVSPSTLLPHWFKARRSATCSALLALLALPSVGCTDTEDTRTLGPRRVAITAEDEPIYDDGELTLYEAKTAIALPILEPSEQQRQQLWQNVAEPYPHNPWVDLDDVKVQVTWTISNLDEETHNVELLIDPWNEFGRYWPGLALVDAEDGEFLPNLSGFDDLIEVPGTKGSGSSRVSGTVTFQDMREMAVDLATVMYLIQNPPETENGFEDADPLTSLANHAFHVLNRSEDDPLIAPYKPSVIAGLTGLDAGLRTYEQANVALEVVVEVVDKGNDTPVASEEDESNKPLLRTPEDYITVGTMP